MLTKRRWINSLVIQVQWNNTQDAEARTYTDWGRAATDTAAVACWCHSCRTFT